MNNKSELKHRDRFLLLRELYQRSDGVAVSRNFDIAAISQEINMSVDRALDAFDFLEDQGLTKWVAIGKGAITPWGIQEIKDTLAQKPSGYFPPDVIKVVLPAASTS